MPNNSDHNTPQTNNVISFAEKKLAADKATLQEKINAIHSHLIKEIDKLLPNSDVILTNESSNNSNNFTVKIIITNPSIQNHSQYTPLLNKLSNILKTTTSSTNVLKFQPENTSTNSKLMNIYIEGSPSKLLNLFEKKARKTHEKPIPFSPPKETTFENRLKTSNIQTVFDYLLHEVDKHFPDNDIEINHSTSAFKNKEGFILKIHTDGTKDSLTIAKLMAKLHKTFNNQNQSEDNIKWNPSVSNTSIFNNKLDIRIIGKPKELHTMIRKNDPTALPRNNDLS